MSLVNRPATEPSPRLAALALVAVLTASLQTTVSSAEEKPSFRVRYRSADAVYLEAGKRSGLRVGDRLEVVRGGEVVAVIEIVFAAEHSSSARPMEQHYEIRAGDSAHPLGELHPPKSTEPAVTDVAEAEVVSARPPATRHQLSRSRKNHFTGVAEIGWERFSDDTGRRDVNLQTARLSLRGRRLGGLPIDLRVRTRSQNIERDRPFAGGAPAREDRDRLYELALRWSPSSDRWSLELGRLGAGAFTGIGYLDGASGSFRVRPGWQLGAFYGRRPELAELGFDSAGTKCGFFSRWTPASEGRWEVFVAGVDEEDDAGDSRQLAVLETRFGFGAGSWSLYERAELALGGDDDRLTQLTLLLSGRFNERSQLIVSYDRNDPLLLFEDAEDAGPAARFDGLLRQGLRARFRFGRERGIGIVLTAGVRDGEGEDETTYSYGLGVHTARFRGFSLGGDVLGFSNPATEGVLTNLRARYGFTGGHVLDLTLGATFYSEDLGVPELGATDRETAWGRLSVWVELPASLFARAEVEITTGDDAEGQRLAFGLGYRF